MAPTVIMVYILVQSVHVNKYSSGYQFSRGPIEYCIHYNVSGQVNRQGTQALSRADLIEKHNSYRDNVSLKLDADLRYIPGQLTGS